MDSQRTTKEKEWAFAVWACVCVCGRTPNALKRDRTHTHTRAFFPACLSTRYFDNDLSLSLSPRTELTKWQRRPRHSRFLLLCRCIALELSDIASFMCCTMPPLLLLPLLLLMVSFLPCSLYPSYPASFFF
jgi:hypothetical protein